MLVLAAVLTIATVLVELMLLYRSDVLLATFKRHAILAVSFSVALSWMLGIVFGAAGMVVLFAAVASTVVATLIHKSGVLVLVKRIRQRASTSK